MPRSKHLTQVSPRWAFWKWFDIPDRNDPSQVYLRRLRVFQTPWLAMYVHWIFLPDGARAPHDHPWNFWSLILRGGYSEMFYPYPHVARDLHMHAREWNRWSWHKMPRESAHNILTLQPGTITLVFTGKRRRVWGFWTDDGFVPFNEYEGTTTDRTPHQV